VLLADDNETTIERVQLLLRREFEVVGAVANGEALLEAAARIRPDVIVSDISMPLLDGLEAARRLKQQCTAAKIVFLTVYRDPELLEAALDAGVLGYVLKTRLHLDLIPAIRLALAGRQFVSPSVAQEPEQ
jgi:DNA-binding NarL/FixJ family response regulator